ncbi:MAG: hypothetical protein AAFP18_08995 [Bacteroidota bacterium]
MLRSARFLLALLPLLVLNAGCDTADDEAPDGPRALAGTWMGPITHPNPDFSGTLTLVMSEASGVLSGTGTWRYPTDVITGTLVGNAPAEGTVTYTLDFGSRGFYFHEVDGRGDGLSGTWESTRGIRGTVALDRQ